MASAGKGGEEKVTEYIEREAAIELLSQPITMSMCLSTEECHNKIAQQRIDRYLIENIPAADVRPVVRKPVVGYEGLYFVSNDGEVTNADGVVMKQHAKKGCGTCYKSVSLYWAERYGINRHTLYDRLYRHGWPVEKALTTPVRRNA